MNKTKETRRTNRLLHPVWFHLDDGCVRAESGRGKKCRVPLFRFTRLVFSSSFLSAMRFCLVCPARIDRQLVRLYFHGEERERVESQWGRGENVEEIDRIDQEGFERVLLLASGKSKVGTFPNHKRLLVRRYDPEFAQLIQARRYIIDWSNFETGILAVCVCVCRPFD